MSAEFSKIIADFVNDILITFPEYRNIISKWWNLELGAENDSTPVFNHCVRVFKDHFFNILNKNVEIMTDDSFNTEFLPGIVFKYIWKCEISDSTRDTIWKYLQLILFSIVGDLHETVGTETNMFDGIDESTLKDKLAETFEQMRTLFENQGQTQGQTQEQGQYGGTHEQTQDGGTQGQTQGQQDQQMPDVDEHIKHLMNGKLGKLAMEFAEDTAKGLDLDIENATNTNDAFQKLFKNPANLMNVVKNVGEKLDGKIKSGEIKESEILAEGMELINNMKNIPGMENMQNMFASMGLGGGQKMNQGATNSKLQQNLKMAQMRERMRRKQQENQTQQCQTQGQTQGQQQTQTQTQQQVQPEPPDAKANDSINLGENKKKKKKSKK